MLMTQDQFDLYIGHLDRLLSILVMAGKGKIDLDEPNKQTLKHHAEDMILAGECILKHLKSAEEPVNTSATAEVPVSATWGPASPENQGTIKPNLEMVIREVAKLAESKLNLPPRPFGTVRVMLGSPGGVVAVFRVRTIPGVGDVFPRYLPIQIVIPLQDFETHSINNLAARIERDVHRCWSPSPVKVEHPMCRCEITVPMPPKAPLKWASDYEAVQEPKPMTPSRAWLASVLHATKEIKEAKAKEVFGTAEYVFGNGTTVSVRVLLPDYIKATVNPHNVKSAIKCLRRRLEAVAKAILPASHEPTVKFVYFAGHVTYTLRWGSQKSQIRIEDKSIPLNLPGEFVGHIANRLLAGILIG